MRLRAYVRGVGLLGPGLDGWLIGAPILAGLAPYVQRPTALPIPTALPPAERRRTGAAVKLALATAFDAVSRADVNPAELPTVFAASGGDGHNCHEICLTLASNDRQISPTRFHNAVHNAASGYWSIAASATPASNVVSAFDASFGAGLLEALCQVAVDHTSVLLVSYDSGYPEPLHAQRPIPDVFGVAMVLEPADAPAAAPLAIISTSLTEAPADRMDDAQLEAMRVAIPAARSLPLLAKLARQESGQVIVDYLEGERIAVEISAWR